MQNVHDKQEYTGTFLGFCCTEVRKCASSKTKNWSRAKPKQYMMFCVQLHQGDCSPRLLIMGLCGRGREGAMLGNKKT